ncbi:hypothetical protein BH20ACI1_BH20ACI1_22070 [soil metagenome]
MAIARLGFELQRIGKTVEITIIDPDRVESGNIPRSNFCTAEIGRFKAQTLAERITLGWGLEIAHINERLKARTDANDKYLTYVEAAGANLFEGGVNGTTDQVF